MGIIAIVKHSKKPALLAYPPPLSLTHQKRGGEDRRGEERRGEEGST